MSWEFILNTLGLAVLGSGAVAYVAKALFSQVMSRDLEKYRAKLREKAAEDQARLANDLRQHTDAMLLDKRQEIDRQMATFKSRLDSDAERSARVRAEVVRWANPILASIGELRGRLGNILDNKGYLMLSADIDGTASPGWSASHAYFLPSSVYLFGQYFCWTRLLEEKLSFELFEAHDEKDRFFNGLRAAAHKLSGFPLRELKGLPGVEADRQIFTLEQRALGEVLAVAQDDAARCMGYAAFLDRWDDPAFQARLAPMIALLDGLTPDHQHRWQRLRLFATGLDDISAQCRQLLDLSDGETPP